jgi:ERF superfamily
LIAAQMAFDTVRKESINPHFRAKYADLATVIDAVLPALNANGFALTQPVVRDETGMVLQTRLVHTSGQELVSEVPLPDAVQWQQWGSALTYARRYTLMALLGVAPEDDDAAEAIAMRPSVRSNRPAPSPPPRVQPREAPQLVKLTDQWGVEYLRQPGEVDQWIRDAIDGATAEQLKTLSEKNPDNTKVQLAVSVAIGEAEAAAGKPAMGAKLKERCKQIADIFRAEQTLEGLNRQEKRLRKEIDAMPDQFKARISEIFHECRTALPQPREVSGLTFDEDIAHLEPKEWQEAEGRVEDPRQHDLLVPKEGAHGKMD